jgi:hypothetical protein
MCNMPLQIWKVTREHLFYTTIGMTLLHSVAGLESCCLQLQLAIPQGLTHAKHR